MGWAVHDLQLFELNINLFVFFIVGIMCEGEMLESGSVEGDDEYSSATISQVGIKGIFVLGEKSMD